MRFMIVSIPDLCTITYFYSVIDFGNLKYQEISEI